MQQYVVIARDGEDSKALERRITVRPKHLEGARKLKANNNFIIGGAILNEKGMMSGSVMLVQFESDEAMKEWFDNEPYVKGGVWEKVEIKPFKVADV